MIRSILLSLIFNLCLSLDAQEQAVSSQIDSITLFRAGAQIHRTASTQISSGRTEVMFKSLSSEIDVNSLRVSGHGNFTILSVSFKRNFLEEKEKEESLIQLEDDKYVAERKLELTKKQLQIFMKEEAFLDKNMVQLVGLENAPANPDDVEQLADFHRQRMFDVLEKQVQFEEAIKKQHEIIFKLGAQINQVRSRQTPPVGEVTVVVNSGTETNANFNLDYFVRSASWQPVYEARVKNVSSPIVLHQKAKINQNTGEDWENVQLTLSTGNPALSGSKPHLKPWLLDFYRPYYNIRSRSELGFYKIRPGTEVGYINGVIRDINGEALIGANVLISGTNSGTITDIDGKFRLPLQSNVSTIEVNYVGFNSLQIPVTAYAMNVDVTLGEGRVLEEVIVSGTRKYGKKRNREGMNQTAAEKAAVLVEKALTTFNYAIKIPVTIKSNRTVQTVDIQTLSIPASYQYYAVPKLDTDAFLVATISNWEQYGLLSAETNLFFEGTYLGKSYIDFESVKENLIISLGRDKNIIVRREKLKDFTKKQLLGGKRIDSRTYEISIVNKKSEAIKIRIEDQIPISKNKKIDVDIVESSNSFINEDTGIARWNLNIPSSGRKKLRIGYKVKYPKGKYVKLD